MSSGVEADIALDAAVVLSLGMNRVAGKAAGLTAVGAEALAALAQGRAEARASALAEAERQDRVLREVIDRNARIAVLADAQREAGTAVSLPAPLPSGDQSPEELMAWCTATDQALNEAERRITEHRATQLAAHVFAVPAEGLRADFESRVVRPERGSHAEQSRPGAEQSDSHVEERRSGVEQRGSRAERDGLEAERGDSKAEGPGSEGSDPGAGRGDSEAGPSGAGDEQGGSLREGRAVTLARVLARLAPNVTHGDQQRVAEAAGLLAEARTDGEAEGLLSEVRLRVQEANRHSVQRRAEERRRAAERDAEEQAEAERRYVLETVTTAFQEMGYEVDAGFETLTAHEGAVVLTRGNWPDHSVKMRVEDTNQLRAAMVRTRAPANEDDRRRDAEREREWCEAFEAARERLAAAGIRSDVTWRVEPGDQELPVRAQARQTRTRVEQRARQRERET